MARPAHVDKLTRFYSAPEFMALPLDDAKRYELIRGEIREMSQPGKIHSLVCGRLMAALNHFLWGKNLGMLLPPASFSLTILGAGRDTVRSPDLAFLAKAKLTNNPGSIKETPDLTVEVYSPNDRPGELREKLADYQQAGWNIVWVIYPWDATPRRKINTVEIYRFQEESRLEPAQILLQNALLQGEGVLDGFVMPVSELF